jgi:hypothetical protein
MSLRQRYRCCTAPAPGRAGARGLRRGVTQRPRDRETDRPRDRESQDQETKRAKERDEGSPSQTLPLPQSPRLPPPSVPLVLLLLVVAASCIIIILIIAITAPAVGSPIPSSPPAGPTPGTAATSRDHRPMAGRRAHGGRASISHSPLPVAHHHHRRPALRRHHH